MKETSLVVRTPESRRPNVTVGQRFCTHLLYVQDPQIHSRDGEGFGMGNMGNDGGIKRFIESHVCNDACRALGLRPMGTSGDAREKAMRADIDAETTAVAVLSPTSAQIASDETMARRLQTMNTEAEGVETVRCEEPRSGGAGEGLRWTSARYRDQVRRAVELASASGS